MDKPALMSNKLVNANVPIEMAWIDLETTGLTVNDKIIEAGLVLTDRWGREHSWWSSLVVSAGTKARLQNLIPIVREMHEKSGLLDDISWVLDETGELNSPVAIRNVEMAALSWLKSFGVPSGVLPLSGSSVHFDHKWLDQEMPILSGWFTHRNIDVSTVRGLCKMHNRPVYDARMKEIDGVEVTHRVIDDIRMSIDEYQFYVDNFLFTA